LVVQNVNRLKRLLVGVRPWALPFYVITLVIGFVAFSGRVRSLALVVLAVAALGELLIHSATNVINDVYDFYHGIDDPSVSSMRYHMAYDKDIGPSGARKVSLAMFLASIPLGVIVAVLGRPLAILLGLIGIAIGYFYTAPPLSLKYRGLGDVGVMAAGLLLSETGYYLASGSLSIKGLLVGVPISLLIDDVLLANNIRDISKDSSRGAKTVATMLGPKRASRLYFLFLALAYIIQAALAATSFLSLYSLASLLSVPLAFKINEKLKHDSSWLGIDVMTANLAMAFGLLEVVGLVVSFL
jgi:1,4-dihydroxy-2-naphthoate octaprenyltransferase